MRDECRDLVVGVCGLGVRGGLLMVAVIFGDVEGEGDGGGRGGRGLSCLEVVGVRGVRGR